MRIGLLFTVLVTGCGLGVVGVAVDDDAGTSVPDAARGPSSSVDASPFDAGVVIDASTDAPDAPACDASSCAFADCKALHAALPAEPTGIYELRRNGTTFQAYCEMDFDDGGWTLIGQSATGGTGNFGWTTKRGIVTSTTEPYAIGARELGLATDELLLAAGSRAFFTIAYRLRPPEGFPGDFESTTGATQSLLKVKNDLCGGASGDSPNMLTRTGRTNRTDVYFFRDLNMGDDLGLRPGGWSLFHDNNCGETGRMQNEPGLLFAR